MDDLQALAEAELMCPICGEKWEPVGVQTGPHVDAIADVFGMSGQALGLMHRDQWMRQREREINQHMRAHPPEEWLPRLMQLRAENEALLVALAESSEFVRKVATS